MNKYTDCLENLMSRLSDLPGIGNRSAERIAFHLLKEPPEKALALAEALRDIKTRIRHCSVCYNLTEADPCNICSNPSRDAGVVCVVEQPKDLLNLEGTGIYRGVYHVLLGQISPQRNVGPSDLTIDALISRVAAGTVREMIMATNPTLEGDGTALYIQSLLASYPNVSVTRLARGLATGAQIEYANGKMLSDAIAGRQKM